MVLSKVGLSGASGMVGGAIIREVLARGMTGRLSSRKTPEVNHPSLHWSPWDLIEWKTPNGIDNIFSGVDDDRCLGYIQLFFSGKGGWCRLGKYYGVFVHIFFRIIFPSSDFM